MPNKESKIIGGPYRSVPIRRFVRACPGSSTSYTHHTHTRTHSTDWDRVRVYTETYF